MHCTSKKTGAQLTWRQSNLHRAKELHCDSQTKTQICLSQMPRLFTVSWDHKLLKTLMLSLVIFKAMCK